MAGVGVAIDAADMGVTRVVVSKMCEIGDGQGPFVVFNALEAAVVGAPARSQGFGGEAIITFPARKKFSLDTVWWWSLARRYLAIRLSGAQPVAIFSSRVGLPVAARWGSGYARRRLALTGQVVGLN